MPIDVRGKDGYVVAPPSVHRSGSVYTWEIKPEEVPLAQAPPWLLDFVSKKSTSTGVGKLKVVAADLSDAPGVAEGKRHSEALRLIGAELGRGQDPAIVETNALAWAERCTPPMPEEEVRRIVTDLAESDTLKALANQEDIEALPIPDPPPWPVLDDAALYGLVGDIVRAISPHSEADPVALLVQTLVVFGNMVGRGPHYLVEGDTHHTNLFAVMVGKSSKGRKGTSMGRVMQLARATDPDWCRNCVTRGLASGEGMIWQVRDPIEKNEPVKEKGQVVRYEKVIADHGVEDKRLLITETEFAQVLRVLRREGNTLSPILRAAWDGEDLRSLVKNNPVKATGPHSSVIGHVTRDELKQYLTATEMFNGFGNRFLWVYTRRARLLADGGGRVNLECLSDRLAGAVMHARSVSQMVRTPAASELWRTAYSDLTDDRPGLYGAMTGRAEAQVLRLSMLYALLDGSRLIDLPHMIAALALWCYCQETARLIFGEDDAAEDPLETKVLGLIRAKPDGMTRTELHKALSGHLPAKNLVKSLASLRDRRLIVAKTEETPGRRAERWFPVGACEGSEGSERSELSAPAALPSLSSHTPHASGGGADRGFVVRACEGSERGELSAPASLSSLSTHPSQASDGGSLSGLTGQRDHALVVSEQAQTNSVNTSSEEAQPVMGDVLTSPSGTISAAVDDTQDDAETEEVIL